METNNAPFRSAILLAIIFLGIFLLGRYEQANLAKSSGKPANYDIGIKLMTPQQVTAGAPVVVKVSYRNPTTYPVYFSFGAYAVELEVLDAKNQLATHLWSPDSPNLQATPATMESVNPGGSRSQLWILSGLYGFDTPGNYQLRVKMFADTEQGQLISQNVTTLTATSAAETSLQQQCAAIFAPVHAQRDPTDFPSRARRQALYYVRDDAVLPYINWLISHGQAPDACVALRRIGSKRSLELLSNLTKRTDAIGLTARQSLQRPVGPTARELVIDQ